MYISQFRLCLSHFCALFIQELAHHTHKSRTAHHLLSTISIPGCLTCTRWHLQHSSCTYTYTMHLIHTYISKPLTCSSFCALSIVFSLASQVADFGNVWSIIMFFLMAWRERLYKPFFSIENSCGFKVGKSPGISPPSLMQSREPLLWLYIKWSRYKIK